MSPLAAHNAQRLSPLPPTLRQATEVDPGVDARGDHGLSAAPKRSRGDESVVVTMVGGWLVVDDGEWMLVVDHDGWWMLVVDHDGWWMVGGGSNDDG